MAALKILQGDSPLLQVLLVYIADAAISDVIAGCKCRLVSRIRSTSTERVWNSSDCLQQRWGHHSDGVCPTVSDSDPVVL